MIGPGVTFVYLYASVSKTDQPSAQHGQGPMNHVGKRDQDESGTRNRTVIFMLSMGSSGSKTGSKSGAAYFSKGFQ